MIKADEEVVFMYAVVPKELYGKVNLPHGCYAKAIEIGPFKGLLDRKECFVWGGFAAEGINRVARKLMPELAEAQKSNLIKLV